MTESEWLTSEDPQAMLRWADGYVSVQRDYKRNHKITVRKRRLFYCAVLRSPGVWARLGGEGRHDVLQAEAWLSGEGTEPSQDAWEYVAVCGHNQDASTLPKAAQAALLREIVGDPFRPPTWIGIPIITPEIASLAQAAYDERSGRRCAKCKGTGKELSPVYEENVGGTAARVVGHSPVMNSPCPKCHGAPPVNDGTLDNHRLLVAADALEEAGCVRQACLICAIARARGGSGRERCGCVESDLLAHLRSPGSHVRGCWALDLILGNN